MYTFLWIEEILTSQTYLVLMSFTSDLLLFIKHATKSVGNALPILTVDIDTMHTRPKWPKVVLRVQTTFFEN